MPLNTLGLVAGIAVARREGVAAGQVARVALRGAIFPNLALGVILGFRGSDPNNIPDRTEINGATFNEYQVSWDDEGQVLTVDVTYTDPGSGGRVTATSPPIGVAKSSTYVTGASNPGESPPSTS